MKISLILIVLVIDIALGVVVSNGTGGGLFGFLSEQITHNSTSILESIQDMAHLTAVRS